MNYAPEYERKRHDAPSDVDRVAAYRDLAAASASRRRSPLWPAALAIVTAIAIVAGAFGVVNYRRANTWQERTRAADQDAGSLQVQLNAMNTNLDKAQTELKIMSIGLEASNNKRDALQARIDALTAEQSNTEDQPQLADQPADGAVSPTSEP